MACGQDQNMANRVLMAVNGMWSRPKTWESGPGDGRWYVTRISAGIQPGRKTWKSGPDGGRWHVVKTKNVEIRSWRRAMACGQGKRRHPVRTKTRRIWSWRRAMACGQDQNKANPVLATGDGMCPGPKQGESGPDGGRWHVSRTKNVGIRSWRRAKWEDGLFHPAVKPAEIAAVPVQGILRL